MEKVENKMMENKTMIISSNDNNLIEDIIDSISKSFVKPNGMLSTSDYFDLKLNEIKLSDSDLASLKEVNAKDIIFDKILGAFKIGDIILTVKEWNKSVHDEIAQKKRDILLGTFLQKVDYVDNKINILKNYISNIYGNIIFNKILAILDEHPLDKELFIHLANILKNMSHEDFVHQFERQRYALALISQLTPQALTILSDYNNWVQFECNGIIVDNILKSDWLNAFVGPYCRSKEINSIDVIERIRNSVNELLSKEYIQAVVIDNNKRKVIPTSMGKLIIEYLI